MNLVESLLQTGEEIIKPWAKESRRPEANRLDVVIHPQDLTAAVEALQKAHWGYLAAITGLDRPAPPTVDGEESQVEGHIETLYSFCNGAAVLSLRLTVPYSNPVIATVCDLIPSATLGEREMMEMFGVIIAGTPDTSRLILADAWPEGVYPLRKSFTRTASEVDELKGV